MAKKLNGHTSNNGNGTAIQKIVVNSLSDLNHEFNRQQTELIEATRSRHEQIFSRSGMTSNMDLSSLVRSSLGRFLLDGPRDIDSECGYPLWLTPDHYRIMYDREGIAKRVVDCEPEETWAMDPEVFEDEDEGTDTKFEKAWKDLLKDFNIYHHLQRIDVLSGIGQFGVLLMGIDDGLDLNQPVEGCNDDGTFSGKHEYKLLYLRPFDESVIFVKAREVHIDNPRYGLPTVYTIQFRDFPNWGVQAGEIVARDVHWSRIIHIADNLKMSEVYGTPRMQPVYNRLYDLRKIYSSSGEAFWKGAFPGLAFEVDPEIANQGTELDEEKMKKVMFDYQMGLQRYFAMTGVTVKTLPPIVTDPTATVETMLKAIAICKAIPYRVLFGSEEAKLAGNQDSRAWNKRLAKRQTKYISPKIIRPFVDRLIAFGVLPEPKEYFVEWPDLNAPTDQDKAVTALTLTQALQAYIAGNVSQLVPPDLYLTQILGRTSEEKDAILKGAQDFNEENQDDDQDDDQDDEDQEDDDSTEGGLGAETVPDQGNALDQQNLGGSTTISKGAKRVDATFVQQPSLNVANPPEGEQCPPFEELFDELLDWYVENSHVQNSYNADERRDSSGEWTAGGGSSTASLGPPNSGPATGSAVASRGGAQTFRRVIGKGGPIAKKTLIEHITRQGVSKASANAYIGWAKRPVDPANRNPGRGGNPFNFQLEEFSDRGVKTLRIKPGTERHTTETVTPSAVVVPRLAIPSIPSTPAAASPTPMLAPTVAASPALTGGGMGHFRRTILSGAPVEKKTLIASIVATGTSESSATAYLGWAKRPVDPTNRNPAKRGNPFPFQIEEYKEGGKKMVRIKAGTDTASVAGAPAVARPEPLKAPAERRKTPLGFTGTIKYAGTDPSAVGVKAAMVAMGLRGSPKDLASAACPSPGIFSTVRITSRPGQISIRGESRDGSTMIRTISKDSNGKLQCHNDLFELGSEHRSKGGIGLDMFRSQVARMHDLGVEYMETYAAGQGNPTGIISGGYNGFYTWPRFGYDAPIPNSSILSGTSFEGFTKVSELMATKEGRDLWVRKGSSLYTAKFDLDSDSAHMKRLRAYMDKVEKKKKEGVMTSERRAAAPALRAARDAEVASRPSPRTVTPLHVRAAVPEGTAFDNGMTARRHGDYVAWFRDGSEGTFVRAATAGETAVVARAWRDSPRLATIGHWLAGLKNPDGSPVPKR